MTAPSLTGCASRKDHIGAIKILKRDLRIFQALNQEIFNELTSLLTLDDFRCEVCWSLHEGSARCLPSQIKKALSLTPSQAE